VPLTCTAPAIAAIASCLSIEAAPAVPPAKNLRRHGIRCHQFASSHLGLDCGRLWLPCHVSSQKPFKTWFGQPRRAA